MRGPERQWWGSYSSTRPVGSPPVTWEMFFQAFYDQFIPRSMRDERRQRFEQLRQEGMPVANCETYFYAFSRHAMVIIPFKGERIRRFVRGLTYSIRSIVFRGACPEDSFQDVVEVVKEEELMEREEFGDLRDKRSRTYG